MDYAERSIGTFLDDVASEAVTPAGGAAAAVVGATGAALCEMVCVHTLRSDEHEGAPKDLATLRDEFHATRDQLLGLADADGAAVDALLSALDADDPATAEAKRATGVPLAVAEACLEVVERSAVVVEGGNPNAVPDAVTGATLAHGALRASLYTVRANLDGIDDASFVAETERRATDLERAGDEALDAATALA